MSKLFGHNSGVGFKDASSASLRGYRFQFQWTHRLRKRLSGFSTVTLRNASGDVFTKDTIERMGADGGMDLVIEIEAKSENACKQVAGKIRKVIEQM